jgi:hypothetical protein
MSEKKPHPLIPVRQQNRCPICGQVSYSRGGVHPQCSVRRADEDRRNLLKRELLEQVDAAKPL